MSDHVLGAISVRAVLKGDVRDVEAILVSNRNRHRRLVESSEQAGIPVEDVSTRALDEIGRGHAGIGARVGPRRFLQPEELWGGTFLVHLDGIEDPFNFGQAVRTLYAAGCDGVFLAPRNWTTATATVTRSSAGATELVPMAIAEAQDVAAEAERREVTVIAGSDRDDSVPLWDVDLTGPTLLFVGGERRGVTRSVLGGLTAVRIPYGTEWDKSLGTVAATAVLAFELRRQRDR
jgi:23S rRNA (guanosine2251-2'-O)-methyltransferase